MTTTHDTEEGTKGPTRTGDGTKRSMGAGSSTPPDTGVVDLAAELEALERAVARLSTSDIALDRLEYSAPWLGEAAVRVHRAVQRLTGKRLQWLMVEDADGRWALGGARTFAQHVAHTHHMGQSRARADVRLARQLRDEAGLFDEALRHGDIGVEQAEILARGALTSSQRVQRLQDPVHDEDTDGDGGAEGAGDRDETDGDDGVGNEDGGGNGARKCDPDCGADGACDGCGAGDGGHGNGTARKGCGEDGAATVEGFLLGQAQQMRPEDFRRLVRHYAAVADPEADERGYRKAQEKEHLQLSRTLDGFHVQGFLTEEHGQLVQTALNAVTGTPAPDETRSAGQRRAQALADMARVVLDQGLAGTAASVRPHLGVLIGAAEFWRMAAHTCADEPARTNTFGFDQAEPTEPPAADAAADPVDDRAGAESGEAGDGTSAQSSAQPVQWDWAALLSTPPAMWADASGPVPAQVLRRMARCGDVYRVLFSPDNEIINHGRAHRVFTASQRRAIIARDRHCTFPGCSAPPALCETHHARVRWREGGATDVRNGALLCFYHHDLVESRDLTMTRAEGRWRFYRRDGTEVHTAYGARHDRHRSGSFP